MYQSFQKKVGSTTTTTNSFFFFDRDNLGSIDRITTITGATLTYYRYLPNGEPYIYVSTASGNNIISIDQYVSTLLPTFANTNPNSLYFNTRLFTGREYDREVSLSYHRARYYSPYLARFIQTDPIGTQDDQNLYRYVQNSPLTYVDRDGKKAKEATVKAVNKYYYDPLYAVGINLRELYNDGYYHPGEMFEDMRNIGTVESVIGIALLLHPATAPIGVGLGYISAGTSIVGGFGSSYIEESIVPIASEIGNIITGKGITTGLKGVGVLTNAEFNMKAMRYMGTLVDGGYGFLKNSAGSIKTGIAAGAEQIIGWGTSKLIEN